MQTRFQNPIIHYGLLASIYAVGGATLVFHTVGHALGSSFTPPQACTEIKRTIDVNIDQRGFSVSPIKAETCDRIVFHNTGLERHEPALGEHAHHLQIPGFEEKSLEPGQTTSLILKRVGNYKLHDHWAENNTAAIYVN